MYDPKQLKEVKARIVKAAKHFGVQIADDDNDSGSEPDNDADDNMRSEPYGRGEILRFDRTWALDDIDIVRGGDGRTVEAYAAVFGQPAEIKDQHGHYMEVIDRAAFNRAISHGTDRVSVFYNHALTAHGTPSDLGSVPIGHPIDIKADQRGLLTVSRFNKSALADSVLEAIRNNDIRGYSFRGRIFQSNPAKTPARSRNGDLPTVTRTELGLSEYGPTHSPYYDGAGIVALRSRDAVARYVLGLDPSTRQHILQQLQEHGDNATPHSGPGAEDSPAEALRSAQHLARRIRVERIRRGIK
jgi:HK97 family phage prohead protease